MELNIHHSDNQKSRGNFKIHGHMWFFLYLKSICMFAYNSRINEQILMQFTITLRIFWGRFSYMNHCAMTKGSRAVRRKNGYSAAFCHIQLLAIKRSKKKFMTAYIHLLQIAYNKRFDVTMCSQNLHRNFQFFLISEFL